MKTRVEREYYRRRLVWQMAVDEFFEGQRDFMPLSHRILIGVLLTAFSLCSVESITAQNRSDADLQSKDAYKLSDQKVQRRRSNAPYFGVPITGRVAQQFEMYSPHSEQALQELKAMGFTQVILDWPNLHAAATNAGLKVVLANWWIDKTTPEEIERGIQRAREVDPESLIGFSVMDEPGRNSPDTPFGYYIDLYEELKPKFRKEFPKTRLEISHWGPMASWSEEHYDYFSFLYEAADVMRIMPYPDLREAPLDDVFFMVHRSQKTMRIAERQLPLVVILQTWILPPDNKLPDIDELRVMAYQALLSGAETVSFFDYNTEVWKKTAGFEDGFRKLMAELTAFSRRHRDDMMTTSIGEDGVLTAELLSSTGVRTSVVVNTRRQPVKTLRPLQVRTVVSSTSAETLAVAKTGGGGDCWVTEFQPVGVKLVYDASDSVCCPRHSCCAGPRSLRERRLRRWAKVR